MAYTQPPSMTKEETDSLLKEAKIARFCSLNKDGTIHAVPVWYKYEYGQMIIFTPDRSRKARNVRRNRNVTVLVDVSERGVWPRCAIIYGKAEIDEDNVFPSMVSALERYTTRDKTDAYAKGLFKLAKWVKITVKPERFASFDYNKDKTYQSAVGE